MCVGGAYTPPTLVTHPCALERSESVPLATVGDDSHQDRGIGRLIWDANSIMRPSRPPAYLGRGSRVLWEGLVEWGGGCGGVAAPRGGVSPRVPHFPPSIPLFKVILGYPRVGNAAIASLGIIYMRGGSRNSRVKPCGPSKATMATD